MFTKDKGGRSACSGACAKAWPPLISKHRPEAGHGVSGSKLGRTKRRDGRFQVTYAGHPLYEFVGDSKPDTATGQGVKAFGGSFFIVAPSGKTIRNG
jgi:predicted lipoprotein with Yx(FWY)xxD motif